LEEVEEVVQELASIPLCSGMGLLLTREMVAIPLGQVVIMLRFLEEEQLALHPLARVLGRVQTVVLEYTGRYN
jgi:hypothetical protein|tara:strand:+ start:236 stop:454 length:219 start_codon:yes stop_codon:yes gene_type:complete